MVAQRHAHGTSALTTVSADIRKCASPESVIQLTQATGSGHVNKTPTAWVTKSVISTSMSAGMSSAPPLTNAATGKLVNTVGACQLDSQVKVENAKPTKNASKIIPARLMISQVKAYAGWDSATPSKTVLVMSTIAHKESVCDLMNVNDISNIKFNL